MKRLNLIQKLFTCCCALALATAMNTTGTFAAEAAIGQRRINTPARLFDEKDGDPSEDSIEPQMVNVLAEDGDWLLIDTWLGPKWINPSLISITLTAAGDCTPGYDYRYGKRFMEEYNRQGQDITYFMRNVKNYFEESDLAIVNLEGTLTNASAHADKKFVFRGPPEFAKILSSSGIDAVTIANNHTYDYFQSGYADTVKNLEAEGIEYFGNEYIKVMDVSGIKVGLFGMNVLNISGGYKDFVRGSVKKLKDEGAQLIIAYYHWGIEREAYPNSTQTAVGRFSIDEGCDLVLGSHPHVLQGIEEYKGKNIVYSLGNFCFGGNSNPADKDSMLYQQTFTFSGGQLTRDNVTNIVPVLISSVKSRNDFQPTPAKGADADRILNRIKQYSAGIR